MNKLQYKPPQKMTPEEKTIACIALALKLYPDLLKPHNKFNINRTIWQVAGRWAKKIEVKADKWCVDCQADKDYCCDCKPMGKVMSHYKSPDQPDLREDR
jgi:hypothetical protein